LFTSWRSAISRIRCPILLMTGSPERGSAFLPEHIQDVTTVWQQGQHVSFEEAGHLISRDAFAPYITVVRDFLRACC
jgi:pimeloyl-ACP methyl ester carboxylesterase